MKLDKLIEAVKNYDEGSKLTEMVGVMVTKEMKEMLELFGKNKKSKLIRKAIADSLYARRDEIKLLKEVEGNEHSKMETSKKRNEKD